MTRSINLLKIAIFAFGAIIAWSNGSVHYALSTSAVSETGVANVGNARYLSQNTLSLGDINLNQGTVERFESDLQLPGKNGLGLTLSRSYSSKSYRSIPAADFYKDYSWGAWMGGGWSFNLGKRIIIVWTSTPENRKAILNQAGQYETYEYDIQLEQFVSKIPNRFSKIDISLDTNGNPKNASLISENGITEVFSDQFYSETHYSQGSPELHIFGAYLSETQDQHANKISIQYESYDQTVQKNETGTVQFEIPHIVGDTYEQLIDNLIDQKINANDYTFESSKQFIRPSQITDSFDRLVNIRYEHSRNQSAEEILVTRSVTNLDGSQSTETVLHITNQQMRAAMITSFETKSTNGTPMEIKFSYDQNGLLTKVQTNDLPPTQYHYQPYHPTYRYYELQYVSDGQVSGIEKTSLFPHLVPSNAQVIKTIYPKKDDGYLLQKMTHPLGSQTEYTYTDRLQLGKKEEYTNYGPNVFHHFYPRLPHATYPVVTKKTTTETDGNQKTEFTLHYPLDNNGTPTMNAYTPHNQDADTKAFYFKSVRIEGPDFLEDTTYHFDKGLPVKISNNLITTETEWDPSHNRQTKITVKKNGIIQTQQLIQSYDAYNNPLQILTRKGTQDFSLQTYTYYSDSNFLAKNFLHHKKSETQTDLTTNKTRSMFYTYTPTGKLKDTTEGIDQNGKRLQTLEYDSVGRISKKTTYGAASPFQSTYQYTETADTYQITHLYNGKSTVDTYSIHTGQPIRHTDSNGHTTHMSYDAYGRPVQTTYPDGNTHTTTYSTDLKTTHTTSDGLTTARTRDTYGRLVLIDNPDGIDDIATTYHYANTPLQVTVGQGTAISAKRTTQYDTYLRPTQITAANWGNTTYSYNDTQNETSVTDYANRTSIEKRDELGRIETQTYAPNNSVTRHTYDAFNAIQMTDPRGLTHETETDSYGRIIKTFYPHLGADKIVNSVSTYYDIGQLKSIQVYDKNGAPYRLYDYTYDPEGRLSQLKLDGQVKETRTYDEIDRSNGIDQLTTIETEDAISQYDFDNVGRIVRETTTIKPVNQTIAVEYDYTQSDQLKTLTYPDGKRIHYTYDHLNRLQSVTYDGTPILTYHYTENGKVDQLIYGNGLAIDYTYENETDSPQQRPLLITQVEAKPNANATTSSYVESHAYNAVANITQSTRQHAKGQDTATKTFDYNTQDELTAINISSPQTTIANFKTFSYDKNGNLNTFALPGPDSPISVQRTIADDADQLITQLYADHTLRFSYDPEGNIRQKVYDHNDDSKDTTTDYTYTYHGQLKNVIRDGVTLGQYAYTYDKRRIYRKTASGHPWSTEKIYAWNLSGQIIADTDLDANVTTKYIYNGNEIVGLIKPKDPGNPALGESIFWVINNLQGTPVRIVDANQAVKQTFEIDEWGNFRKNQSVENLHFTGKPYDPESGLYYFNQRYYAPAIGVFMQPDPAGQTINPYLYAGNNPLVFVDPDGQFFHFLAPIFFSAIKHAAIGAAIGASAGGLYSVSTGGNFWDGAKTGAAIGGAIGATYGTFDALGFSTTAGIRTQFARQDVTLGLNSLNGVGITGVGGFLALHDNPIPQDKGINWAAYYSSAQNAKKRWAQPWWAVALMHPLPDEPPDGDETAALPLALPMGYTAAKLAFDSLAVYLGYRLMMAQDQVNLEDFEPVGGQRGKLRNPRTGQTIERPYGTPHGENTGKLKDRRGRRQGTVDLGSGRILRK